MKKMVLLVSVLLFCIAVPYHGFAQKIGGGDLTFKPKGSKQVLFSHELHVKAKGMKCTSCHYHVFQMSQGSYKMVMSKLTKGDFCGKCHNGRKSFDVKDPQACVKCHK